MTEKKIQISGNIGNAYFIFKGDSQEEVLSDVQKVANAYDQFADAFVKIQQIQLVKEAFAEKAGGFKGNGGGSAKPADSGSKPAGSFNRPSSGGSSGGSGGQVQLGPDGNGTCAHGVKLLDYVKKDGKRCHGWYCQNKDRATQCKPYTLEGHGQ